MPGGFTPPWQIKEPGFPWSALHGSGAGCAGGIMSAAVDGIRVAEAIAQAE
ncbi:hypothetical protein GMD64_07690 [Pseudoflavonifractor sp. BIOML-A17]|nr:hypothetical protein [Pseudoflavonifractor sp. BIOML-A17]MTR32286.1 hypothetical protein [Pseudoflavonifractor sp. BIOML-A14]